MAEARPQRTWVVGDVHGCAGALDALLDAIEPAGEDRVIFLGDYVDRGPESRAVVERLLRLRREGPDTVFLRGNHEDMFLDYLGRGGRYGDYFLRNGGDATLRSYGLDHLPRPSVAARLPDAHVEFLLDLQIMHVADPFLCVHAGVRPGLPLQAQSEEDLLWIRGEFVDAPHPFPLTIVFGHTVRREVLVQLPYKIGLDTGCVYGNKLSCLDLASGDLVEVDATTYGVHRRRVGLERLHLGVTPPPG